MSMCLKMTKTEKRLGRDYDDADCHYHVRGKFGGDSNEDVDDMNSDTRWVKLTELVTNMGESELAELDVWAGQLQKAASRRLGSALGGPRRAASESACVPCPHGGPMGVTSLRKIR